MTTDGLPITYLQDDEPLPPGLPAERVSRAELDAMRLMPSQASDRSSQKTLDHSEEPTRRPE